MIDLAITGSPRLTWEFITNFPSRRAVNAGILAAWVGSLLVILVTAVIAVPVGVAAGIYLEEYAPRNRWTDIIEINVSNLAGVPSIIYGLLALGLFVYGLGTGRSIFTAGLTLALLILPIIIVATREAIRAVPGSLREAAFGLGATDWQVTRDHVLPAAMPGILTGVIIGISRALGETAPLITIGALTFIAFLPTSPFQATFPFVNMQRPGEASPCCRSRPSTGSRGPVATSRPMPPPASLVLLGDNAWVSTASRSGCAPACAGD